MSLWTEHQIEAMVSSETRTMVMPDETMMPMTYPTIIWDAYDDLIDHGYGHDWLLEIAGMEWHPGNGSFELRFSSAIAYAHHQHRRRIGKFPS